MAELEGGYILLSRKLIESEIWEKPPLYLKVWIYILSKAQHKPYKNFDRGELLISIPELIEVCSYKVGYRTEKPTKSQMFNILEWLRRTDEGVNEDNANETMIETTKTTRGMVVKVTNYNVYQDPKKYERNSEGSNEDVAKATMPKRQADTINKNEKNDKNEKKSNSPKQAYDETSPYFILSDFMHKEILKNNAKYKQPNIQSWSNTFRLLIERDKRDISEVSKLIRWVQQDDFEMVNVLSPTKLRARYDNLAMKMDRQVGGNGKTSGNSVDWENL